MNIFKKLTDIIRDVANIDTYIDTDAAERSIRSNIDFKGPNAWILAVAIIIASVGLNVNSIPVIIGAMLISPLKYLPLILKSRRFTSVREPMLPLTVSMSHHT